MSGIEEEGHPLDGAFELPAERLSKGNPRIALGEIALASAAISLKRIADALEGGKLAEKLEDALVRGIDTGADQAIGSWIRRR